MRSALASLSEPAPPELPLGDLANELIINLHMPASKVHAWLIGTRFNSNTTYETCGELLDFPSQQMDAVSESVGLTAEEMALIKVCLGTVNAPFQFAPTPSAIPLGTTVDVNVVHPVKLAKGGKGGSRTEKSEILPYRRAPLVDYYPPAKFDEHRRGCITRNESTLRKMIVQEV